MFNIGKLLTNPPKLVIEKNVKTFNNKENTNPEYIHNFSNKEIEYSINKYDKLMIKMNEDIKRKQDIQKILYGDILIKNTNHSVNDLINNHKYYNFIFFISFISLSTGAFIFYKTK